MTSTLQSPKWRPIELTLSAERTFDNALQEAELVAHFTAPDGRTVTHSGYWDGGTTWRIRFAPDQIGTWSAGAQLQTTGGSPLQAQEYTVECIPPLDDTVFDRHGPVRVASHKRHLEHVDGHPFFWLVDTAWNGPLRATADEWQLYLDQRARQGFTGVQWVATQWRAAPDGDIDGRLAYTGTERIAIHPEFFQRLDHYVHAAYAAGFLNAPVLLWANPGGAHPHINPGIGLPAEQAAALARYMVARYAAYPVVWILGGDGHYNAEEAERWRQIGRLTFPNQPTAPVALHCAGRRWPVDEYRHEPWFHIFGYQSGHGDSEQTERWLVQGEPATEWQTTPRVLSINMEPAYENHLAYQSKLPHTADSSRRAIYWSLLNAPTAGVTYGGHGVWGWDDGTAPSVDHPNSGIPLPWQQALTMPGAEQMQYLAEFFIGFPWHRLAPAQELLTQQPGESDVTAYVLAAASPERDLAVIYTPGGAPVSLASGSLDAGSTAHWFNPRKGTIEPATPASSGSNGDAEQYTPPGSGDWILFFTPQT